tara:strand:+ start:287 stop:1027 length:741 start_codon:yes stop_codon:yes gene_type:complete
MVLGLGLSNELLEYPPTWTPMDGILSVRLQLWLQGGEGVSASAWLDSSNAGNDATQTLAIYQPTVSGNPEGLDFDQTGEPQFLNFNTITVLENQDFSFAFVVKLDENTNQVLFSDSNNEFLEIQNNRSFRIKTNNPSNKTTNLKSNSSVFTTGSTKIIYLSRSVTGVFTWRIDGQLIVVDSATSSNVINTGGFDIQNLCIRNDNDRGLDGLVREVIFYNGLELTRTQSRNLHQYLADKYDITNNHE